MIPPACSKCLKPLIRCCTLAIRARLYASLKLGTHLTITIKPPGFVYTYMVYIYIYIGFIGLIYVHLHLKVCRLVLCMCFSMFFPRWRWFEGVKIDRSCAHAMLTRDMPKLNETLSIIKALEERGIAHPEHNLSAGLSYCASVLLHPIERLAQGPTEWQAMSSGSGLLRNLD